ncbi:YigZ family protein [Aliidiomarina taiwanensis]|uniref:YigZ family protein n=1 Tax=Aliidiomarina taiwanensis TaxID=946228 RepID=A0A432X9B3_9GAMM|nr:YigZ family protein [Aliidiomarina taiwanensis]RUO43831.1 YigZ family protein [Aliidiomarina taiwanensis]
MSTSFWVPVSQVEVEFEIKKSRFIARAGVAESREQAMEILALMQQRYPEAWHHCWAYQLGSPHSPYSAAMNDDGEPSGTAGRPILNVIQHKEIGNLMVVVSRYFGGVKLGAGGLVRSYSAAAEQAVSALKLSLYQPKVALKIACDFSKEQPIRHWLSEHNGDIKQVDYQNEVFLTVDIVEELQPTLLAFLAGQGARFVSS